MIKELEAKLKKADRSRAWFWRNYITLEVCTYAYFMGIVSGQYNTEMNKGLQVKAIINCYLAEK